MLLCKWFFIISISRNSIIPLLGILLRAHLRNNKETTAGLGFSFFATLPGQVVNFFYM